MVAVSWVAGTAAEEVVAHWEKAVAWGVVTAAPLVWEDRDVASAAASAAKGSGKGARAGPPCGQHLPPHLAPTMKDNRISY